jgi:hypothetical protein
MHYSKKCDGFMVASTKTDRKLGTVNIPHEGPEEYNNIWQKVRSMWSYVYDNYYEKVSQLKYLYSLSLSLFYICKLTFVVDCIIV